MTTFGRIGLAGLVVLVATTSLADMLKDLECHDSVVRQGLEIMNIPKEVELLFGKTNVDHFISGFGSKKYFPEWNSVAYFGGRYLVSIKVPIEIDYGKCKLTGVSNSVSIQINEVTKVAISKSGIAGASLEGQWRLNEKDWKRLLRGNGDWSLVNIPILTNSPVEKFDEYMRQSRESIRNRKEVFDDVIKRVLKKFGER